MNMSLQHTHSVINTPRLVNALFFSFRHTLHLMLSALFISQGLFFSYSHWKVLWWVVCFTLSLGRFRFTFKSQLPIVFEQSCSKFFHCAASLVYYLAQNLGQVGWITVGQFENCPFIDDSRWSVSNQREEWHQLFVKCHITCSNVCQPRYFCKRLVIQTFKLCAPQRNFAGIP